MQEKQKKAIRWISPVLIALTALIVWRVNYEIEFMMDDEWYSTVLYADTPIRNLSDIIRAQIWHYFNWGGRSMAHALLQGGYPEYRNDTAVGMAGLHDSRQT